MKVKRAVIIGRFQPPHKGHFELIKTILDEGKEVLVLIRETKISEKNPFTYQERKQIIKDYFGEKVKVRPIPDISEFVYGRKVGYKIRKVIHKYSHISATEIRKKNEMRKL